MEYEKAFSFFKSTLIKIQKSIIPLYKWNYKINRPDFVGTSVYCNYGPIKMLYSAKHVFQEIIPDRPWYPYSTTEMRNIPFEKYIIADDESIDIGIIQLTEELEMWKPIPFNLLSGFDNKEEYQHLLVGYPGSSTKKSTNETQKIEIKGYLTSAAKDEEYTRLKVDKSKRFVVLFKKKNVYKENLEKMTFPNPNGMSGGGVFQFNEKNPNKQYLVGIMTDWDIEQYKAIIATRIESVTDLFKIWRIDL